MYYFQFTVEMRTNRLLAMMGSLTLSRLIRSTCAEQAAVASPQVSLHHSPTGGSQAFASTDYLPVTRCYPAAFVESTGIEPVDA